MNIQALLKAKGERLLTNRPEDTLEAAAQLLSHNNIGALPVRDSEGRLVGMVSERDIVRRLAELGGKALSLKVGDAMTRDVSTCSPLDSVKSVMETMRRRHIRHVPVVDGGALVGIISQRDVLHSLLEQTQLEVNVLRDVLIAKG
ncbi:MAG: CBS domain-containing protein [Thermoleophilia bacterium]|nr:CBS domain-containing protein [Thermoleophilia bacterium]